MSHNKITVGGQSPSSSGDVSLSLNALSDVTISSASSNNVLQYDGSSFVNSVLSGPLEIQGVFTVFQKNGTSYSPSGSYTVSDYLFLSRDDQTSRNVAFVDASFVSSNPATSANTIKSNTKAMESFNVLQAGTYLCICSVPLKSSNGGYVVRWHSNAGGFGAKSDVHYTNRTGSLAVGIITAPANDVLRVVIETMTGSTGATGASTNRSCSIHILKI